MTTLENRPGTALLVLDVQNRVVGDAYRRDEVVANIHALVERARSEDVPVVWVQHSDEELAEGSDEWQIVPELDPRPHEEHIRKNYAENEEEASRFAHRCQLARLPDAA